MHGERHYPTVYKFTSVALMAFAVYVFHRSSDLMIRLYAVIEFLATLNSWAASEDEEMEYGDLYLLVDGLCAATYFLTMLDLYEGVSKNFFLYSIVVFALYFVWNILLMIKDPSLKNKLRKYQLCNGVACAYSCFAYYMVNYYSDIKVIIFIQYIGMVMWLSVLIFWYRDFYFESFMNEQNK